MIPTFLVTIITLLTFTTFTAMSSNVGQVEAVTTTGNCAALDATLDGECDVAIDYDGNCAPTGSPPAAANCNINLVVPTTVPGKLRLNYLLETGIFCNNVAGGSASKAFCLNNNFNNYASKVTQTGTGTMMDNQFNFQGSQQIRDTDGQDKFKGTNTMDQNVNLNNDGATGSTIKTDVQLKYLQDIVKPDDTTNTNTGRQYVSLDSTGGGVIDTTSHEELGYSLQQTLKDIDDRDNTQSSPISATNSGYQILGIDSDNGANINFDTHGLSTISQLIESCKYSTIGTSLTECINRVGLTPSDTTFTGQYTQLTANGLGEVLNDGNDGIAGTTINVDNQRQLIDQKIKYFEDATNGKDAMNIVEGVTGPAVTGQGQYFLARAEAGGDINMALGDVEEQTQSISQSITNSDENTFNKVVPLTPPPTPKYPTPTTIPVGQGIFIGDDPRTTATESVLGLVEADVDQKLTQSINGITSPGTTATAASNTGTMTITLLAKEGASKLFVEGFDQYLTQTASYCSNCHNNGQVHATFEVTDAATFTLQPGSDQGLTQTVTQNGKTNTNAVISTISVSGDNTKANIGLEQELTATNGNRQSNPNSIFTAEYGTGTGAGQVYNQQCNINSFGTFTQVNNNPGACS